MNHPHRIATALAATAIALLSGCASIVNGTQQVVNVDTPGCAQASCTLTNSKGSWQVTTPGTATVHRAYGPLQVACAKAGVSAPPASIDSATKAMAFGNIVFGGVIGAGVDIGTGAAYDYPASIAVPFTCAGTAGTDKAAAK